VTRIERGYEDRLRARLRSVGARRAEEGVKWMLRRAEAMSAQEQKPLSDALNELDRQLATKPFFAGRRMEAERFFCDGGLGGLARWLRAAGYEAFWEDGLEDSLLLSKTREAGAVLLTTDSMLMERKILRDGTIKALWLPPTLRMAAQLEIVWQEFGLELRESRCMRCGGKLERISKQEFKDQIPPRTFLWLDEFFKCQRCSQLFWHGTHWNHIRKSLEGIAEAREAPKA